jgi:beta-lactam-binding protein with PASTA domain
MNMAENTEKEKKGFFQHWIVKNLLGAIVFILLLVLAANILLGVVTRHNREILVPDFSNLSLEEAQREAANAGIRVDVTDSIFVRRMERGAVYSQNPKAGSKVKQGRRILLTINAMNAKKVGMPNLVGYSMRQAKAELLSKGLALGRLIYVSDMATNNVLRQIHRNHEIRPGRQIETGSEIDLVVGLNPEDNLTYVPDVNGMKYLRAVDAIQDNSLNISRLQFDSNIRTYSDSLNAVVYRQSPGASKAPIIIGSDVSLYLRLETEVLTEEEP